MPRFVLLCLVATSSIAVAVGVPVRSVSAAAMCTNTSTGLTALTDLGAGTYQGEQGGLYPGGSNAAPSGYLSAGIQAGRSIVPRDTSGNPSANGRIVFLSIGMSNTSVEFNSFVSQETNDAARKAYVSVVNGAQPGEDATKWLSPSDATWAVVEQRLGALGLTDRQVQAVWLKQADVVTVTRPGFESYGHTLQQQLTTITSVAAQKFPYLRQVFVSARSYGGYGGIYPQTQLSSPNPEPWAYQTGFAVKWYVAQSVANPGQLPWVGWGPYFWTDGTRGRSDGLQWLCSDTVDGTHPSSTGQAKIDAMLRSLFVSSALTPWFAGAISVPPPSATPQPTNYATPSPGATAQPGEPRTTGAPAATPGSTHSTTGNPTPFGGSVPGLSQAASAVAAIPAQDRGLVLAAIVLLVGAGMAAFALLVIRPRKVRRLQAVTRPHSPGASNGTGPPDGDPAASPPPPEMVGAGTAPHDSTDRGLPPQQ